MSPSEPASARVLPRVLPHVSHVLRALSVTCVLLLIALCLLWELRWAPLPGGSGALAFKALPLCLPLAGLLKGRLQSYRGLSLGIWLYFTEGVVRAYSDSGPSSRLALIEVVLSLLLFVACVLYVRLPSKPRA